MYKFSVNSYAILHIYIYFGKNKVYMFSTGAVFLMNIFSPLLPEFMDVESMNMEG